MDRQLARMRVLIVGCFVGLAWACAPESYADEVTSISGAGRGNWTTPQGARQFTGDRYTVRQPPCPPNYGTSTPLPVARPLPGTAISPGPTWIEVPAAPAAQPLPDVAASPPVVEAVPCPPEDVAAIAEATWGAAPDSLCGLACCQCSEWHVRGLFGRSFKVGDDPADVCLFAGLDVGRTFCGCWGLDFYYRYHSGQFDRQGWTDATGATISEDGGHFHHVGLKLTYERGFTRTSRWYWWAGLGAGYFWSEDYIDDDDGFEVFAEAGVGFVLARNWRIRGGVNVIMMDTSVGREQFTNAGVSRTHWVIAPVIEVEFTF